MSKPRNWADAIPPSLDDIADLAQRAYEALPANFREKSGDIVFVIDDFADESILNQLEIEDPFDLTGLYSGPTLAERVRGEGPLEPPMVYLFRRPLLDEWVAREEDSLFDLVQHVLVHEIGHHFGMSDQQIDAILGEAH